MIKQTIYLILFSMLFIACNKDDDGNAADGNVFRCSIDGSAYTITGTYAFADKIADDLFGIYGNEEPNQNGFTSVYISLTAVPTVGTYDLSDSNIATGNIFDTGTSVLFTSGFTGGQGVLEVTEVSDVRIKGFFSFTAVSADGMSKEVKEGEFDVAIQ